MPTAPMRNPNSKKYRIIGGCLALVLLALLLLRFALLPYYDRRLNAIGKGPDYTVSPQTRDWHEQLFVADMHADTLLWSRDLEQRQRRGHVDLPRLRDGGVDLQVFGVVTQAPRANANGRYGAGGDRLPLLFIAAWRPLSTWFSPRARALQQAAELRALAERGSLSLVLNGADLSQPGSKALLALEGLHALEGRLETLDELHRAGFRMLGLAHFTDNAFAGSAWGEQSHGLTGPGRAAIRRMENLGMTIDLAHASPAAFAQTLALATRPVVVSHGGVAATCPGSRNLDDAQLRALAANGGVVGIGYWKVAVCGNGLDAIVDAIRHAVSVAGIDHVGLGSDFDGAVTTPFDAAALPMLTQKLLDAGFSRAEVAAIMGANLRRVLQNNLP